MILKFSKDGKIKGFIKKGGKPIDTCASSGTSPIWDRPD
jgi:hypothetical protein